MKAQSGIEEALSHTRYYMENVRKLAREQWEWDFNYLDLFGENGRKRQECLEILDALAEIVSFKCDSMSILLRRAVEMEPPRLTVMEDAK